jgi:hypothetical protein
MSSSNSASTRFCSSPSSRIFATSACISAMRRVRSSPCRPGISFEVRFCAALHLLDRLQQPPALGIDGQQSDRRRNRCA